MKLTLSLFVALHVVAPRVALADCGDGTRDVGEACDDGNTNDNDGCTGDCQYVESNYTCPTPGQPCREIICGDGYVDPGEACDDGSACSDTEPNACRTDCRLPYCGDGVTDTGETCDDSNVQDGDGCDSNCTPTGCGNGVLTSGEMCDDGNLVDGDGCDSNCLGTGCGNGVLVEADGETCDDGNTSNDDSCKTACGSTMECCLPNYCGDAFANGSPGPDGPVEVCDGTDCSYDCQQDLTLCGNGTIDSGELCDFGPAYNSWDPDALCRPDCQPRRCGDGVVDTDAGEECDLSPGCGPLCAPL